MGDERDSVELTLRQNVAERQRKGEQEGGGSRTEEREARRRIADGT